MRKYGKLFFVILKDIIEKLRLFGEKAGIAFQIKDDLFDYEEVSSIIGKPVGIDIKEKKMTLPLIYALNNAEKKERKWMINVVKNHNENNKKVSELISKVKESGGIQYAEKIMQQYKDEALQILEYFEHSVFKQSLIELVNFTIERKK